MYPDVPGQGLYFSGVLDTLLLQLLPFLHITAQPEFLFSRLIHSTFQHLNLILLVLDQLTFQLHFAGDCKTQNLQAKARTKKKMDWFHNRYFDTSQQKTYRCINDRCIQLRGGPAMCMLIHCHHYWDT